MTKKIYAVRKRCGQWTVSSDEKVCLNFQSYDEAIETARTAAIVLSHRPAAAQEEEARPGALLKSANC
jgi:hypothetical protein